MDATNLLAELWLPMNGIKPIIELPLCRAEACEGWRHPPAQKQK